MAGTAAGGALRIQRRPLAAPSEPISATQERRGVVAVQPADVFAAGFVEAAVARARKPEVLRILQQPDARVRRRKAAHQRGTRVSGPIVDDKQLKIAVSLPLEAADGLVQVARTVEDRHDDGDSGLARRRHERTKQGATNGGA